MPPQAGFSRTMQTVISNYVRDFLLVEPSILKFFQKNNLIRQIPKGQDRWRYFDEKSPGKSKMTSTIHDATILGPEFAEQDVQLMKFVGKIRLSKEQLDKFKTGTFIGGDLMARTVAAAVREQRGQVDAFIAWGDETRSPGSSLDAIAGQGVYTGILNGGTELAAGGGDNIMTANGDYVATMANYYDALQDAGHQANEYVIVSDPATRKHAFQGAHYLTGTGSTEYARVLNDYPWLKQWIATPNCKDTSGVKYRIALIQPKQMDSKGKINNTMELIMGYQFEVTPVANGGITESGNYEAFLETSCALVEFWPTANQRSPTLTIA